MVILKLKGTQSFRRQGRAPLILQYYLVESLYHHKKIYGIQIQSHQADDHASIHSERISNLSYSLSYVNHLIHKCMEYSVSPTDLFYSLDLLMESPVE